MSAGQEWDPVVLVTPAENNLTALTSAAEGVGIVIKRSTNQSCKRAELRSGRAGTRIGWIIWRKDLRRWDVLIRTDASPAQAGALVAEAIRTCLEFGTHPGHGLRRRPWKHRISDLYGRHAFCHVVALDDRESSLGDLEVEVPDDLSRHMDLLLSAFSAEVKS